LFQQEAKAIDLREQILRLLEVSLESSAPIIESLQTSVQIVTKLEELRFR